MGIGRDRNAPCWCGSGKKYKKCHIDREQQDRDNPWTAVEENKKAFSKKLCWAKDAGIGDCEGKIISAHTVSMSSNLKPISNNGHIVKYTASVRSLNKTNGSISISRLGIREASVFNGFCAKHDKELFSCIENHPFVADPNQCLAMAYRTLSWERYGKDAASHLRETLRGSDKGRSKADQIAIQQFLDLLNKGNEASRREIGNSHDKLTKALANNDTSCLHTLVIEIDGRIPFMFAGGWSPFTDIFNSQIQDGESEEFLQQIVFYSFSGKNFDYICISWLDEKEAPGELIARQLDSFDNNQKIFVALYLAIRQIENIFFSESWFNSLSAPQRAVLDTLAEAGVIMSDESPPIDAALQAGISLPTAKQSYFIK